MALQVGKPSQATRRGKSTTKTPARTDIYDVKDSDGDELELSVDDIDPNPFNKRAMGDLEELKSSIIQDGLVQNITVMEREKFVEHWGSRFPEECAKLTKKWVLGPGERRWRATQLAGLPTITAKLQNRLVPKIRTILITENFHRLNPTPLEHARAIQGLSDEGLSYSEICEQLSIKSRGTITKFLQLLELPDEVQQALEKEEITPTAARTLLKLPEDGQRIDALLLIRDEKMRAEAAVHHVLAAPVAVSVGNGNGAHQPSPDSPNGAQSTREQAKPEPAPHRPNSDDTPAAVPDTTRDAPVQTSDPTDDDPQGLEPAPRKQRPVATENASDRHVGAKEREHACVQLLQQAPQLSADQADGLLRRALLTGTGKADTARGRAHAWLSRSGRAHYDITNTEGYFQAVLSSDDQELIERATLATALAACEIRAADKRRRSWDQHDAAYISVLINAGVYVPSTQWEEAELGRLGVSAGNTDVSGDPNKESL